MMFKLWWNFPRWKPKKEGMYLCQLDYGLNAKNSKEYKTLYYISWRGIWLDKTRQDVFNGYKVYPCTRAPIEDNRVHTDVLCDLTRCVKKWKKLY